MRNVNLKTSIFILTLCLTTTGLVFAGQAPQQATPAAISTPAPNSDTAVSQILDRVVGREAVLSAKMVSLASWSAARRKNAAYYDAAFADLDDVRTPTIDPANESIYNQYTLRVAHRDGLQGHLRDKEIGTAIYYPLSLHLQPCFEYLGYKRGAFPESERATQEVLIARAY